MNSETVLSAKAMQNALLEGALRKWTKPGTKEVRYYLNLRRSGLIDIDVDGCVKVGEYWLTKTGSSHLLKAKIYVTEDGQFRWSGLVLDERLAEFVKALIVEHYIMYGEM